MHQPTHPRPQYILQRLAWTKVLPPHFLEARHRAILRAQEYEMQHGGPVTPMHKDPMAAPAQQLTVGATPLDGRTSENMHGHHGYPHLPPHMQQHQHQQHMGMQPHHPHFDDPRQPHLMGPATHMQPHSHPQQPGGGPGEHGYYMQENMNGEPGFTAESPMTDMAAYQHPHHSQAEEPLSFQDQASPHHYQHDHELQHPDDQEQRQQEPSFDQFHSPHHHVHDAGSQLQYSTEADDRSRQSSSFQREVEEEGAFVSSNEAP